MGDIEKLKEFCVSHPELVQAGIIKGINSDDGKVVLEKGDKKINISVSDLYNFDFDKFEMKTEVLNNDANIENEEIIESIEESEPIVNDEKTIPSTLKQIKDCVDNKDEKTIDEALKMFALDQKTGTININNAINIITSNSLNNVIECVKNNSTLSDDLSNYDITGKMISINDKVDNVDVDKLINDSFNNILIYVDVARLKNILYDDLQINNARKKYETSVKDRINVLGLNKEEKPKAMEEVKENEKVMTLDLKPDTNLKKAGFADIIILTIIVLIYAAIIINLIMKIK